MFLVTPFGGFGNSFGFYPYSTLGSSRSNSLLAFWSASAKSFSTFSTPFLLVRSDALWDTNALAFFQACLSPKLSAYLSTLRSLKWITQHEWSSILSWLLAFESFAKYLRDSIYPRVGLLVNHGWKVLRIFLQLGEFVRCPLASELLQLHVVHTCVHTQIYIYI